MNGRVMENIKRRKQVKVMTKKRRESKSSQLQQLRTARIAKTLQ